MLYLNLYIDKLKNTNLHGQGIFTLAAENHARQTIIPEAPLSISIS